MMYKLNRQTTCQTNEALYYDVRMHVYNKTEYTAIPFPHPIISDADKKY